MARVMINHTKKVLENVSFDPKLFYKEIQKAIKSLLPYEIEELKTWLKTFTQEKPELAKFNSVINL